MIVGIVAAVVLPAYKSSQEKNADNIKMEQQIIDNNTPRKD